MNGDTPGGPPGGTPGGGPPGGKPNIPLSCTSSECQSALATVAADRNRVLLKCAQVEATKSRRDTFAAIGASLLAIAAALLIGAAAATASVLGAPLAPLLFWLAVSFAATAVLLFAIAAVFEIQYLVQQGELNAERTRFANAVSDVTSMCPSSCWGDISVPACPD
jgi:hypothetical protein